MIIGEYEIVNIDRHLSAAFGGQPSPEFDSGVVYGAETEIHPITGVKQRRVIFSGTVAECHRFVGEAK